MDYGGAVRMSEDLLTYGGFEGIENNRKSPVGASQGLRALIWKGLQG